MFGAFWNPKTLGQNLPGYETKILLPPSAALRVRPGDLEEVGHADAKLVVIVDECLNQRVVDHRRKG